MNIDTTAETALAVAQSEMQDVLRRSGLRKTDLAARLGKPRSFITKIFRGDHNLTLRTMARVFAACGYELGFHATFVLVPELVPAAKQKKQKKGLKRL